MSPFKIAQNNKSYHNQTYTTLLSKKWIMFTKKFYRIKIQSKIYIKIRTVKMLNIYI